MLNPDQIAESIEEVLTDLDNLVDEVRLAGNEAARAEVDFKVAYAQARMAARATTGPSGRQLPGEDADDRATVETEEKRFDYLIAGQTLMYTREAKRAKETRLDGLRTLSASIRGAGG